MNIVTINPSNSDSPFDSIRRYNEQGNEYWIARELMGLMGYRQWRNFETTINQAIENLELNDDKVSDHFLLLVTKSQGRDGKDFKLTRYASYMTALCCDGRKPEVAAAKKYFAIKTREAETVIPAQSDRIRQLEIELEISRNNKAITASQAEIVAHTRAIGEWHGPEMLALYLGKPDAVVEITKKVTETIVITNGRSVSFEGQSLAELARELGFKTGAQLADWLRRNKADHFICEGFRKVSAPYIPTEDIKEVKKLWSANKNRQLLIGE